MKANIAFCPHFHQPHFQLQSIREEVYRNCYLPWLELLEKYQDIKGFHINLHFSGPLLRWLAAEKPEYIERIRILFGRAGFGMIGGLVDEAFTQLSARPDDIMYQMKDYDRLTKELLGVEASDWEAIHVVEREAGEWNLYNLAQAARSIGTPPFFYLDAESVYEEHFNYPGGQSDYCRRHFGFDDQYSRTTVSHFPPELLFYGLRDEIGGQEFFVIPVHSQFRYRLLKRKPFGSEDRVVIDPRKYCHYLLDAAERSREVVRRLGRNLQPLIVIFEDAEKFGQWSQDPSGDARWLEEFFRLVAESKYLQLSGLGSIVRSQGYLDTYPAATSRCYPEWENWTARRGIRGVTFGDEKLRKLMSRQRDLEKRVDHIERLILKSADFGGLSSSTLQEIILNSPHRAQFITEILSTRYPEPVNRAYRAIQRVRNIGYQEDARWASRHPSYGSCSYFDLQGLSYLELAERLSDLLLRELNGQETLFPEIVRRDWDHNGEEDLVIRTAQQTLVINLRRGQVIFHQILNEQFRDIEKLLDILERETSANISYPTVLDHSHSLVFTETDSTLREEFYPEGARLERCRNSMNEHVFTARDGKVSSLEAGISLYDLEEVEVRDDDVIIKLMRQLIHPNQSKPIEISKVFTIEKDALSVAWGVGGPHQMADSIFLVPEIVTSAVPSDEIDLKPSSWLVIRGTEREVPCEILRPNATGDEAVDPSEGTNQPVINKENGDRSIPEDFFTQVSGITAGREESNSETDQPDRVEICRIPEPETIEYFFVHRNGRGVTKTTRVCWEILSSPSLNRLSITPAVRNYYHGHVFPAQSRLGYESSGVMMRPVISSKNGNAFFKVRCSWGQKCETAVLGDGMVIKLLGKAEESSINPFAEVAQ